MKVPFLDKRVRHQYYALLSVISVIASILFLFVDIIPSCKNILFLFVLVILVIIYFVIWIYSNIRQSIKLKINSSEIEVKFGDIFTEDKALKVIAFNEYFDTQVDESGQVVATTTLNGQFIEKFYKYNIVELDDIISGDSYIAEAIVENNPTRKLGKKTKYKLGTICVVEDYLLLALTHFNDKNIAYLEINDYINCLLKFWNEIDRIYAGRVVALPLLGSGITRFKGYENISDQELLELIIWTFKVSRIKFSYPSKVIIVVYHKKIDKVNLLALKDLEM